MHRPSQRRLLPIIAAVALVASACSGGGGGGSGASASAGAVAFAGKLVNSVTCEEGKGDCVPLKAATIQLEGQGSFRDPEAGEQAAGWRGSGFFIDPSGIAITNNHVVTGAGSLNVWVGGNHEVSYHARVLGASECSDIAVVKVDGGPFPYLDWYGGTVDAGLDIYVGGFPLGDPTYTLTKGIVAKAATKIAANWSDVEKAIQHDAATNPGNSGGPVVAAKDGKVVAVHYAGNKQTDQAFAISEDEVKPILDMLKGGSDVNSIGINGTAVKSDTMQGVWVSAVKAGSPASKAGILPGDVITKLEGVLLSQDGTMKEYCDVLRSHQLTDALGLEVIRSDTQEVLKGELNGKVLEKTFSFAQELQSAAPAPSSGGGGSGSSSAGEYDSYTKITDDSGALVIEVPSVWNDTSGAPWVSNGKEIGVSIEASTNMSAFDNGYDTPGVYFAASKNANLIETGSTALLEKIAGGLTECTPGDVSPYDDGTFTGSYQAFKNCGGGTSGAVVLVAMPAGKTYIVLVVASIVSQADLAALDHIFQTFDVVKALP